MSIQIFQGDTFTGIINLRLVPIGTSDQNPYPITEGSLIQILFPGVDSVSVILSTENEGEITVIDGNLSTLGYVGSPEKSAMLNPGLKQSVDVVITAPDSSVTTFERMKVVNVVARANPLP